MRHERFFVVPLLILVGCKSPTPAEQMESIQSWLATAGMTGEAWLRHTTPDKYSRQTLELSGQTLSQISKDLLKSPPPSLDSAALDKVLSDSRTHVARMAHLIEAKDAPSFARELDSLVADAKIVKQLSDAVEPKQ